MTMTYEERDAIARDVIREAVTRMMRDRDCPRYRDDLLFRLLGWVGFESGDPVVQHFTRLISRGES